MQIVSKFFTENRISHFMQMKFVWNVTSYFLEKIRKIFQSVICWKFYPACWVLSFTTLRTSNQQMANWWYFSYFSQKILTFHTNCFLCLIFPRKLTDISCKLSHFFLYFYQRKWHFMQIVSFFQKIAFNISCKQIFMKCQSLFSVKKIIRKL